MIGSDCSQVRVSYSKWEQNAFLGLGLEQAVRNIKPNPRWTTWCRAVIPAPGETEATLVTEHIRVKDSGEVCEALFQIKGLGYRLVVKYLFSMLEA